MFVQIIKKQIVLNMNIALITLHRAENYGSVLQTLALQNKLEELGNSITILDYYPERFTKKGLLKRLKDKSPRFKNPLFLFAAKILIYPSYLRKGLVFGRFIHKYLKLSDISFATNKEAKGKFEDADAYCTGSDQVWNSHWNEEVEKALFLDFVPKNKLVFSYAASIGLSELPECEKDITRQLLDKYEFISVRENTGVEIIRKLGREDAVQSLDPTLLMTKEEWNCYTDDSYKQKEYILTYNLHHDPEIDKYAQALRKKYHIPICNISYNWHDIIRKGKLQWCPSVEGFLGLIKHARFVIADSFHATVFSIIFERPFVTITPEVASSRISSLLAILELSNRNLPHYTDISVMESPINYTNVKNLLVAEQDKSMKYLRKVTNCTSFKHNRI